MEVKYIKLDSIKPADYNPRKIEDSQFEKLKESISKVGFVIPILVNSKNNTIVAGHQRSKAAAAIGMTEVPAFFIDNLNIGDEIRFNQLHNGVDKSELNFPKLVNGEIDKQEGFLEIDSHNFVIPREYATQIKEICKLIVKYGNVFCAIVCNNKIILHSEYVKACQLLNINANISVIRPELEETALSYFKEEWRIQL